MFNLKRILDKNSSDEDGRMDNSEQKSINKRIMATLSSVVCNIALLAPISAPTSMTIEMAKRSISLWQVSAVAMVLFYILNKS